MQFILSLATTRRRILKEGDMTAQSVATQTYIKVAGLQVNAVSWIQ
jgi:hypothetical protein